MPCEKESVSFTEKEVPDLTGYTALITGGNSGIGFETTKQLALHNARVYIGGRSAERVNKAIADIKQEAGGKELDLHFLQLDLMDLKSLHDAAAKFMQQEKRLDLLINNAGVMMTPYSLTKDGYETQWQINAVAPQILSMSLLPILMQTAAESGSQDRVRVVTVSSDMGLEGPKTIQFDDVNLTNTKGMLEQMTRYQHSKQGAVRFTAEFNRRYREHGISAYSLHPGIVRSNLQNGDPTITGTIIRTLMKVTARTTALEGCYNSLFLATSPLAPARGAGKFFMPVGKRVPKGDKLADDTETNSRLFDLTAKELEKLSKN